MIPLVVTIDGPAAAGKSTTAREVARRLGCLYLDSGALFRALALQVARRGLSPEESEAVQAVARATDLDLIAEPDETRVLLNGEDVTDAIRSPAISELASRLAELPEVRSRLVEIQRRIASSRSIVAEGRDTGTVVFPEADVKIYLDASLDERAERRHRELEARGVGSKIADVRADLDRRDRRDRERRWAPLVPAEGSVVVDTTRMSPAEQVEEVLRAIRSRRRGVPAAGSP